MKTSIFKNIYFPVIVLILSLQSVYIKADVIPDELIQKVRIPSENCGIIPEDIIYLPTTHKFFVYSTSRILVLSYDSQNNNYFISKTIDLYDDPLIDYGANSYFKWELSTGNVLHKNMAYNAQQEKIYVLLPSFEILKINVQSEEKEGVIITKPSNFVPGFIDQSIIRYANDFIYWSIQGYNVQGTPTGYFGIYDNSGNRINFIQQEYLNIHDFQVNVINNKVYMYKGNKIQVRNASNLSLISEGSTDFNAHGRIFYIEDENWLNKVYYYSKTSNNIYYMNGDDNDNQLYNLTSNAIGHVYSAVYNSFNHYIYFGTGNLLDDDILIFNYDNTYVGGLSTNGVSSDFTELNVTYHMEYFNNRIIACKPSEIVLINNDNQFNQLKFDLNNFFYTGAFDSGENNLLLTTLEGNILKISGDGIYDSQNDLQVGVSLTYGCFNPANGKVYLYSKDIHTSSKLVIFNENGLSIDVINFEDPISDCIYNPFTDEILVSSFSSSLYIKAINPDNNAVTTAFMLFEPFCGKMYMDNNGVLCLSVGMNDIQHTKLEIHNGFNYSYLTTLDINVNLPIYFLSASFCENPANNKIYMTLKGTNPGLGLQYGTIREIAYENYVFTMNEIPIDYLPDKIVCATIHNKIYIKMDNVPFIYALACDNINYNNPQYIQLQPSSDIIRDIEYDNYRDFIYVANLWTADLYFIYCNTDEICPEERKVDLPPFISSIKYNTKNRFLYVHSWLSLIQNPEQNRSCNLWIWKPVGPLDYTRLYLRHLVAQRSVLPDCQNDIILDSYNNLMFIPNGSHSSLSFVQCQPERLYLGQSIGPWYNYNCFPSLQRIGDDGVDAVHVLQEFVPWGPGLILDVKGRIPNNPEVFTNHYENNNWTIIGFDEIYSSRGYAINHNVPVELPPAYIQMPGTRLPSNWILNLYTGVDIENWTGYFVDEPQNIFDALGETANDLTLIKSDCWSCTRKFWHGNPPNETGWECDGFGEVGTVFYDDMVSLKSNVNRSFQWQSNGDPKPIKEKDPPEFYTYSGKSTYTPIFVELDTNERPLEIGAFINDTCVGAMKVAETDTIIMVPLHYEGNDSIPVEFEEYFGPMKNKPLIKIREYSSFDHQTKRMTRQPVYPGSNESVYYVSFNDKSLKQASKDEIYFYCYPNPSFGSVKFVISIETKCNLLLEIYNMEGRVVDRFELGEQTAGTYEVTWNGIGLYNEINQGIYMARIYTGNKQETARFILIK